MPENEDAYIADIVARATPLLREPVDLIHVERFGLPSVGDSDKPILALKLYYSTLFDDRRPQYLTFVMDPDGAVAYHLASDSHVDELFAHFSPETPAEETPTTEEPA